MLPFEVIPQVRHGANYFGKLCIELALLAKNVHFQKNALS